MAKYLVRYTERSSIDKLIEAESKEEAERKMLDMVANGEIDLSFAELDESGADAHPATADEIKDYEGEEEKQ